MAMDFSPINVVMLATGGILLFAAKENRSPVNVVKAAFGVEPVQTMAQQNDAKTKEEKAKEFDKRMKENPPVDPNTGQTAPSLPGSPEGPPVWGDGASYLNPYAVPLYNGPVSV